MTVNRAHVSGLAVVIQVHVSCMLFCQGDLGVELLSHIICMCPIVVDNARLPMWIYQFLSQLQWMHFCGSVSSQVFGLS